MEEKLKVDKSDQVQNNSFGGYYNPLLIAAKFGNLG